MRGAAHDIDVGCEKCCKVQVKAIDPSRHAGDISCTVHGASSGKALPVLPCQVLEEVMQIPGGPTAPAKVQIRVAGQLSISHAARLDTLSLLGVGVCSQIESEEAAGQGLQVLLRRL